MQSLQSAFLLPRMQACVEVADHYQSRSAVLALPPRVRLRTSCQNEVRLLVSWGMFFNFSSTMS